MSADGKVQLHLADAFGEPLRQPVEILFEHLRLAERLKVRRQRLGRSVTVAGLRQAPLGLYRVTVEAAGFLPVSRFVNVPSSGAATVDVLLPIRPEKVAETRFPDFEALEEALRSLVERSPAVLGFSGRRGGDLYTALDPIRCAGLLNVATKAAAVPLPDGSVVFDSFEELVELRGDRFFVRVPHKLREEVKNSVAEGRFDGVSSLLHRPPDGYESAGSFKTPDGFGNLQITFFARGADDWLADVDIDDANGLLHVFQVVRNAVTGRPTHPYDIAQILFARQALDAQYRLFV